MNATIGKFGIKRSVSTRHKSGLFRDWHPTEGMKDGICMNNGKPQKESETSHVALLSSKRCKKTDRAARTKTHKLDEQSLRYSHLAMNKARHLEIERGPENMRELFLGKLCNN
jgi:hypothetical protein